jgi:hypothetical protein
MKLYKNNGYEVHFEHITEFETFIQTENELLEDLRIIRNMIPYDKKILFQVHFRPNIIYDNINLVIDQRESIYNIVNKFCQEMNNTFIYDPSILLNSNNELFNGENHFNSNGHLESFNYIYNNYISK